jgi:inorganic pyrophosphatase
MPSSARFIIEVPRGSLVKWGADGGIDFLSPVPCPFNYGSIPGLLGADGDPLDVVILGPRLPRGATATLPIRACARFIDGGITDDKWVCAPVPLRRRDRLLLHSFFTAYAWPKRLRDRLRGLPPSRFVGLDENTSSFTGCAG